jgi:hypothetical protein
MVIFNRQHGELVILVSYSFGSNQNEIVENKNLSYSLVTLGTEEVQYSDAVIYKVNSIRGLKNQSVSYSFDTDNFLYIDNQLNIIFNFLFGIL